MPNHNQNVETNSGMPSYVPLPPINYTNAELNAHIAAFAEQRELIQNLNNDIELNRCECSNFCTNEIVCRFDYDKFAAISDKLQRESSNISLNCPGHFFDKRHKCVICLDRDHHYDQYEARLTVWKLNNGGGRL